MKDYQAFAISNFRTGFDEAVEPWLLPRDAYQSMVNAHLYRGVLEKISGYLPFAKMTYRFGASLGIPNGSTKTFGVTVPSLVAMYSQNIFVYGTIVQGVSAETFSYSGDIDADSIALTGSATGTGTANFVAGNITVTFKTAPPNHATNPGSCTFAFWDYRPAASAIMGIKQYYQQIGTQQVMVFDQKRLGFIQQITSQTVLNLKMINNYVGEIPTDYLEAAAFTGDGSTMTFTGSTANPFPVPGTIRFDQYTSAGVYVNTITDNSVGGWTGTNVTGDYINYYQKNWSITFSVAPASGNVFNLVYGLYWDAFTGNISNFFSVSNYQFKAFFTNGIDPIMYYDGVICRFLNTNTVTQLITSSGGKPSNLTITTCLHVTTTRERLLLLAVFLNSTATLNTIYWSTVANPLNFTNNEFLPASTSEPIRAFSYINTDLVIRFANSERIFRYTSDAFSPFRFDVTNSTWPCDAPYSPINYDTWYSSVGRPAIVGSDGVNAKRVDEIIPDFTDPQRLALQLPVPYMNQGSIVQCYGERFDDFKEGWLCYNSQPEGEMSVTASDNILAFNYLDETYAIYAFPFSCLGFGKIQTVPTWGSNFTTWEQSWDTWGAYSLQLNSLIDLAGDQYGIVYELDNGNVCTVAGDSTATLVPVLMSVITKNFNPFVEDGQLARLGYVDLFVSADSTTILRVQFYINDQLYIDSNQNPAGYYQETILTFNTTDSMSPTTNQTKVWKRIYVGAVGKEHTIRFYQNIDDFGETDAQPVFIHAMILYMKPAGRVFQ